MSEKRPTVEFRLTPTRTPPAPKPLPGEKAERLRLERDARKARNLALAYYIDSLIRSGEVEDLAAVARLCLISRARISNFMAAIAMPAAEQEHILCPPHTYVQSPPTGTG